MAAASSAAGAASASKHAATEELSMVETKLEEVDRQLAALEQERAVLLARQASLKETLNTKTVDVDWSGAFAWDEEVARVKAQVFGIAAPFRPAQREAINCTISGSDCFVVMRTGPSVHPCRVLIGDASRVPCLTHIYVTHHRSKHQTGGGKSLVYQLPALLDSNPGLSLVISPLISLICDQTYQLEQVRVCDRLFNSVGRAAGRHR